MVSSRSKTMVEVRLRCSWPRIPAADCCSCVAQNLKKSSLKHKPSWPPSDSPSKIVRACKLSLLQMIAETKLLYFSRPSPDPYGKSRASFRSHLLFTINDCDIRVPFLFGIACKTPYFLPMEGMQSTVMQSLCNDAAIKVIQCMF